eukprot:m51a1_g12466 hypothetical protein (177) ;mRNA; r:4539-5069
MLACLSAGNCTYEAAHNACMAGTQPADRSESPQSLRELCARGNVSCASFRVARANWSAAAQDALRLELISALGCDSGDDLQLVAVEQTQDSAVLVAVVGPGDPDLVDSLAQCIGISCLSGLDAFYGLRKVVVASDSGAQSVAQVPSSSASPALRGSPALLLAAALLLCLCSRARRC